MKWTGALVGDMIIYKFGHTFSHGAIVIKGSEEVLHAFYLAGRCLRRSPRRDTTLTMFHFGGKDYPRERKIFRLWEA